MYRFYKWDRTRLEDRLYFDCNEDSEDENEDDLSEDIFDNKKNERAK